MLLKHLTLQNFRNYTKSEFGFNSKTTIIIGPNAIGKSNILEAIYLLSTGKSFRTDRDKQLLKFGQNNCRIKGFLDDELEVVLVESATGFLQKKYLINGVSKRRADFAVKMPVVLFTPLDLDLVAGQPGVRRRFLDEVLMQTDSEYHQSLISYTKALRQRNALLEQVQETGSRDEERFSYWDDLLIKNGQSLSKKRAGLIEYINNRKKEIYDFDLEYDKSEISKDRLMQYKNAEVGAGVTLVGPHRDDVMITSQNKISKTIDEVRYFGSRGQQRLVSLELKLAQIALIKEKTENEPLLLLDDVFSELDATNIGHVLNLMDIYQTIATTTHEEFIGKRDLKNTTVIELGNK
ncbi:MAG TPA: DNA replication and repair protein RecF [Candidatus Saccharimonadales bacterium]|nr:DNA replication and repair protein RecF [Candidatus Saccharimonadales bacterium]